MAISYVAEAEYIFSGTASTDVNIRIPSGVQEGDLILASYGNVSNPGGTATMNNSWTKIREAGTSDNCYFLMVGKIATATEVSAAGNTVQVATLPASTGQTIRSAQSVAYRGTDTTVGGAVIASNFTHETSPADQTVPTNSATATSDDQWYVCFFNMAAGSSQAGQSFSSNASTFRGLALQSGSTSSANAVWDSGGTTTSGSKNFNGTWSGSATRLNAGIAIIAPPPISEKSDSDTGSSNETQAVTASRTVTDTASSTENRSISATFTRTDTGSGTSNQSILAHVIGADLGIAVDSGFLSNKQFSESDTGSSTESVSIKFTRTDSGSTSESMGIVSVSDWTPPVEEETSGSNIRENLVLGPATIYVADFGSLEPSDIAIGSPPDSGAWTDLGGLLGGAVISLTQEYETSTEPFQVTDRVNSRLKKRQYTAEANLAEPALANFVYLLNGGTLDSGDGWESYTPPPLDRATPLEYRAVIIDGWAPGFTTSGRHKRRRVILRKCLSIADIELSYTKDKQTVQKVVWASHRVDGVIAPVKIIDEIF
jgi:hypothetical protein